MKYLLKWVKYFFTTFLMIHILNPVLPRSPCCGIRSPLEWRPYKIWTKTLSSGQEISQSKCKSLQYRQTGEPEKARIISWHAEQPSQHNNFLFIYLFSIRTKGNFYKDIKKNVISLAQTSKSFSTSMYEVTFERWSLRQCNGSQHKIYIYPTHYYPHAFIRMDCPSDFSFFICWAAVYKHLRCQQLLNCLVHHCETGKWLCCNCLYFSPCIYIGQGGENGY